MTEAGSLNGQLDMGGRPRRRKTFPKAVLKAIGTLKEEQGCFRPLRSVYKKTWVQLRSTLVLLQGPKFFPAHWLATRRSVDWFPWAR